MWFQKIDHVREQFLKFWQYCSIFLSWYYERYPNSKRSKQLFLLYQKIFYCRRMFRMLQSVVYMPLISKYRIQLKKQFTFKSLFALLSNIFLCSFLFFDNLTILMIMGKNNNYRMVRRISYTILLAGIVWQAIEVAIKLRQSFTQQSSMKSKYDDYNPEQFLSKLREIDSNRKIIALQFIEIGGQLLPTLARTNLPELILRTRINKGTVGIFGMISAICSIILKLVKSINYPTRLS